MSTVFRKLDGAEEWHWRLERLLPNYICMVAECSGSISAQALPQALQALQKRHPLLRSCIRKRMGGYFFCQTDQPIPFEFHDQATASVEAIAAESIATVMDYHQGPLVKCVLIRQNEDLFSLFLVFSHAITDGLGAIHACRELVHLISVYNSGSIPTLTPLPLRPAASSLRPANMRGIRNAIPFLRAVRRMKMEGAGVFASKVENPAPLQSRKLLQRHGQIEPEIFLALKQICRSKGISTNSALCASAIWAFIRDNEIAAPVRLNVGIPIDLRRKTLSDLKEDILVASSGLVVYIDVEKEDSFWSVANKIHNAARISRERNDPLILEPPWIALHAKMLRFFQENRLLSGFFKKRVVNAMATNGVFISNFGNIETFDTEGFDIRNFYGMVNPSASDYPVSVVSVYRDRLNWYCTATSPSFSQERLEIFVKTIIDILTAAIHPTDQISLR